mmetsp:Transcript_47675/g.108428  ORF Transcript_47675/g.108428 Transcript_47675/m.108428 type:complete len:476 (+) Transcript_47675:112-1539(+)
MCCGQHRLYLCRCAALCATIIRFSLLAVVAHSQEQCSTTPVPTEPSCAELSCAVAAVPKRESPLPGEASEEGPHASCSSSLVQRTQSVHQAPFHTAEEQGRRSQEPVSVVASAAELTGPSSAPQHGGPEEHVAAPRATAVIAATSDRRFASTPLLALKEGLGAAVRSNLRRDVAQGFAFFVLLALLIGFIILGSAMGTRSPPARGGIEEASSRRQREEGGSSSRGVGMPSVRNVPPSAYPGVYGRSSPGTGVQLPPNPMRSTPQVPIHEPLDFHLCPELVVPEGSECTLVVPRLPGSAMDSSEVTIDDAKGAPVFHATFSKASTWGSVTVRQESKRLILSNATGEAVFAFCRDVEAETRGGPIGLVIHYHSDAPFGTLRADTRDTGSGYTVVARQGSTFHFRGQPLLGNMNVTDEKGRLLAIAEPMHSHDGSRRSVRIGPLVDAGLVTLAMLGIDILEHQRTRPPQGREQAPLAF